MTEFEAATLAYQYAGLWVAGSVGFAQCLLIGLGLWYMRRASDHRDKQHAEIMTAQQQQHAETMATRQQQHAETMTTRQQQHAETVTTRQQQHAETVTGQQQEHAETMTALTAAIAALKQQGEALRVVIERTEPAGRN